MKDADKATWEVAKDLGLSQSEYAFICDTIGRAPTLAEAGIFSAMYSEHCSYKSSKRFLKNLPTKSSKVLQGPGENAGIVNLGYGWAVAFKMESHNHPSFIEPYQGAATGVGGILRDIFTMGARPIACLNGLCFGDSKNPDTARVSQGVVKGIGNYGNSVGIPTVAGQTIFHSCYNQNPLVNAMTVGLIKTDGIFKGIASGVGNDVIYVGAKTGRDGVRGASMASKEFSTEAEPDRPAVQVGDPFTENLLLEACLEIMENKLVVGIQDMGAAGLTSSSFEMSGRAGTGLEINLDLIPTRERGMSAFELLLSESQERMLLVAEPKNFSAIESIFEKWDLHAVVIGKVIPDPQVKMTYQGQIVVALPVDPVVNPPMPERPTHRPTYLDDLKFIDEKKIKETPLSKKCDLIAESFSFGDPKPITEQYDSTVGVRTLFQGDAAVLRLREIKNTKMELGMTLDGNPKFCFLDPEEGAIRAICESANNLAVVGHEPLGVTDCLNFASPENPETLWQFEKTIEGIKKACEALDVPVISGNVSFYNETDRKPIYPTPLIGMVGSTESIRPIPSNHFFEPGLEIFLLGPTRGDLAGSLLVSEVCGSDRGKLKPTSLEKVKELQATLRNLRKINIPYAAHDISEGGLFLSLLEMCFPKDCGVEIRLTKDADTDAILFGEGVERAIVACKPQDVDKLKNETMDVVCTHIGKSFAGPDLRVLAGEVLILDKSLSKYKESYQKRWEKIF